MRLLCILLMAAIAAGGARAAEVRVAVAANFTEPFKAIGPLFERATGNRLVASYGATGHLFAQVMQGAPFEVLLAADSATPAKAVAAGIAVAGSTMTYAVGRLVLYSRTRGLVDGPATLRTAAFQRIAIANPATAPYGSAAIEVMRKLGVLEALQPRIVQGQSIAQAFKFVETGNAEVGFVALAQVATSDVGSRWLVPADMHAPIEQDAVLLKAGDRSAAARDLLAFLRSREAREMIERFGYGVGD